MQAKPLRRFTWAVVHPYPEQTAKYLNSEFATAAAHEIECRQYLALVLEKPPDWWGSKWLAFLVEPETIRHEPLPKSYLPIRPCNLGTS
jgi:hypothetical protein